MPSRPTKRRIGILGGMGPEATVLLMSRIIARTPAADDSDHVPLLVDNNTQVPSRIKALIEKTGEDPGPVLTDMARRLEAAGVAALAMPCNTAHHYASRIRAAVSIPFLDMIELSADAVAGAGRASSGSGATPHRHPRLAGGQDHRDIRPRLRRSRSGNGLSVRSGFAAGLHQGRQDEWRPGGCA